MPLECSNRAPRYWRPKPHDIVPATAGQQLAVGANRYGRQHRRLPELRVGLHLDDPQLFQLNIKVKDVAGAENVGGFAYVGFRMAGSDGNPGPFHQLMGRPMIPVEYCATLGTKGDILLCDFTQYLLIDKAPRSAVSMHVRFLNDEQTFRLTYRVDGQPIWNKPLTPFKGTNTLSPFISLDTRG
ncbi:hypothetical protein LCGC14_2647440 [marine sediment metagenome]|uniref:Phage capsid-like C-terminal domain-containing protein n=1 Tax=marine sediment metagenome TaxID=412755 RepID=A0A0F9AI58_9ZZZZ